MTLPWPVLLSAAIAMVLAGTNPIHASCGVSGPLPAVTDEIVAAKVVFVGSVLYTTDNNRTARVRVASIWKGPRLPAYVDVHGEAPGSGPFSGSEGDHQFRSGQEYLFIPLNDQPPFQDYGDCNTSTQPWTAALVAYAPPGAKTPNPPTAGDVIWNFIGQNSAPATIIGLLLIAIISILVLRLRRRAEAPK